MSRRIRERLRSQTSEPACVVRIAPTGPQTAENAAMAWKLRGTYVETCSCEFFCPCNFNLANGADYDRCRATLVFNITDGDVEGTDVGRLAVVVIADTPKVMAQRNSCLCA